MLSLPSKQGERVQLFEPLMKSIQSSSGEEIAGQLEPMLKRLQQYRDDLLQISAYRNDNIKLEMLANECKEYISMWNNIAQSFTFGKFKSSVDVKFIWYDSHTRKKKVSTNPNTEKLAMLYNLAIIYSQIGANLLRSLGDHYKEAASNFLKAAWILEKIKAEASGLEIPDFGLDLSEQNLHMHSYIMKAQAQDSAYHKVKTTNPDKHGLLAKVAMQASVYYGNAYSYATAPPLCKILDQKNFIAVLQFNEISFIAKAYYWDALEKQKTCTETTKGMGKAVASIRKANQLLEGMKRSEKSLPPSVLNLYKELCKELEEEKARLENKNLKVYCESVPTEASEIECMSFGQPISIEEELNKPYGGQAILQRMVPAAVRDLEEEYKKEIGDLMARAFDVAKKNDYEQAQALAKLGLPSALHASSGNTLPEDLWQRIKQCKERGGYNGLIQVLNVVSGISESNNNGIKNIYMQLNQEDEEDQSMRNQYGNTWSRSPSSIITQGILGQTNYCKQKLDEARATDQKIKETVQSKKPLLDLLELDKDTLTAKIPKNGNTKEQLSPAAAKYYFN